MVDYQSVSITIAAATVAIYVVNMLLLSWRENKNRRITLANVLMQKMTSEESSRTYIDLLNWSWKDYDDFERKYGSDNNPDAYARRFSMWQYYNNLGFMLREKLVDADTLFDLGGNGVTWVWAKWEPIIKVGADHQRTSSAVSLGSSMDEELRVSRSRDVEDTKEKKSRI